jgi:hypothetical protein
LFYLFIGWTGSGKGKCKDGSFSRVALESELAAMGFDNAPTDV